MTCPAPAIDSAGPSAGATFRSLQAKLFTARGRRSVRVVAMSDGEATVACLDQPPCDSFAYLVRNGIKVPAMIAWTGEDRLGLRLEASIWTTRTRDAFHASRRHTCRPCPSDPEATDADAAAA